MMTGLMFQQQQQQQQQAVVEDINRSNLSSCGASGEASTVSIGTNYPPPLQQYLAPPSSTPPQTHQPPKKKRSLPGNPDPDAEVMALSPKTLLAKNRFICEICNKGFQREQNLQLHRRGHNLPWKLKQRAKQEVVRKKVYVCPEPTCVHHDPSRALGDLTGIKKHFSRKHGEKKWKCDKCSKRYAVQSDWKAHSKTCGTKEYRCDCGTLFSRRDSFITHRAFCDALAEESARAAGNPLIVLPSQPYLNSNNNNNNLQTQILNPQSDDHHLPTSFSLKKEQQNHILPWLGPPTSTTTIDHHPQDHHHHHHRHLSLPFHEIQNPNPNPTALAPPPSPHLSATALLQKAAQMGATISNTASPSILATTTTTSTRAHHPRTHTHVSSRRDSASGLDLSSRADHVTLMTTNTHAHGFFPPNFSFSSISSSHHQGASSFEDGILKSRNDGNLHDSGINGNDVDLTRDFLGLKPLSHTDIFSIAGIGNCMTTSQHLQQNHESQQPWQG